MGYKLNRLWAKVFRKQLFWTYEDWNGYIEEIERPTADAALEEANNDWGNFCDKTVIDPVNDQAEAADVTLIEFFYDRKGDMVETNRIDGIVIWEYYHGDYAEHFRQSDYI